MHFKVFPATEPIGRGDPITPARRKRLFFSYFPDWLLTIVLAALFYGLDAIDGFRREFSLEDTSLRHPYAVHERVPNTLLLIICAVVPFALMPIVNFITVRSYWDFHNSSLGLVLSLALTGAVTQTIKITVGRPRPDIISRCQPPPGSEDPVFGLTNSTICTQTDKAILIDGFRSFPSGHSSLSFAGLGFLAFYLAGKLHLFDKRGHTGKAWISLFPFLGAALVAISRSMDYRHHWQDILVGSLLGTVLSFFSYRQYYPSLSAPLSHRPYSPRIPNDDSPKPSGIIPMYHNNQGRNSNTHLVAPKPGSGGMMVSSSGTKYGNNSYEDLRSTASPDQDYTGYDGTVPRPVPRDLTAVWKEGDDGHEGDAAGRDSRDRDTYPPLPHPRHLTGSARVSESSSGLDHHTPTQAQFVPYPQYASPSSLVAGSRSASPVVTSPIPNAPGTSAVMAESGSTGQRL